MKQRIYKKPIKRYSKKYRIVTFYVVKSKQTNGATSYSYTNKQRQRINISYTRFQHALKNALSYTTASKDTYFDSIKLYRMKFLIK